MAQVSGTRFGGVAKRLRAGRGAHVVVLLAVLTLVGGVAFLLSGGLPDSGGVTIERSHEAAADALEEGGTMEPAASAAMTVHVDGAVLSPGVYELSGESLRVNDAIKAAGGLAEDADSSQMNLAAVLADGQKVHVPYAAEATAGTASGEVTGSAAGAGTGLININLAAASDLEALSGVGEATARAIVEDREANGPFTCTEDLMRVSGIGQKKFQKLKDQICV